MSRKSPSGPIAVTDQISAFGLSSDVSTLTPGDYFVAPLFFALLSGSSFVPVADPSTPALLLLNGPEATDGRIGDARLYSIFSPGTSGSDVKLQFTVNGVPVGNIITVPWVTSPVPVTNADAFAINKGALVDFGDVEWQGGDTVVLQATFGATTGTAQAIIGVIYDKNFK